jgi:hypothetical protein
VGVCLVQSLVIQLQSRQIARLFEVSDAWRELYDEIKAQRA